MSELDRMPLVEGIVVDQFHDRDEARRVMDYAWTLLREGEEKTEQGTSMLIEAHQREAWKVLGFESWNDLLASELGHIRTTITPEARQRLVIVLRQVDAISTRVIAGALGVSHSTVVRDLSTTRDSGSLDDEPDRIRSSNGRMRKSTVPSPRRPDLAKTWRNAVDDIVRRTKTLAELSIDDRYGERRVDLRTATAGDLQRAHAILSTVLHDFTQSED